MTDKAKRNIVQVVCTRASQQIKTVSVPAGSRVAEVIAAAGFASMLSDSSGGRPAVGIYGHIVTLQTEVRAGDRVEIYEPLQATPEAARRKRMQM